MYVWIQTLQSCMVFENPRKSLILHCEWSELRFERTNVYQKCQNDQFWRIFQKLATNFCYQTGHFLIGQNRWKRQNPSATFWVIFKQHSCFQKKPRNVGKFTNFPEIVICEGSLCAQTHLQTIRDHRLHLSRPSIVALEFLETKSKPQEISSVYSLFEAQS